MTKKKKILTIVFSAVALAIIALLISSWCVRNNQPAEFLKIASDKKKAAAYVTEKYGDSPSVLSADPVYHGGFLFSKGKLCGTVVHYNGFDVLVKEDRITDDRQYDDIVAAFKEEYLLLDDIYSEVSDCTVAFDFHVTVYSLTYQEFCGKYFDGDISEFLKTTKPDLLITLDGEGFREKRDETPELLYELLNKISSALDKNLRVYAYVRDPELDLPDMPMEDSADRHLRFPPKRYDDYMELIASAVLEKNAAEITVQQPSFYDIDEFTAISDFDAASRITSGWDFAFSHVDYSQNTTVYRGIYRFDNRAEENVLTIRENGLYCGVNTRLHDFILRLDKEHYGITDSTIALRIAPPAFSKKFKDKQYYVSFGYDSYDCDEKHWYYADDKYLYLYVPYLCSELSSDESTGVYIAFADIEN